jgi:hypothetical protein
VSNVEIVSEFGDMQVVVLMPGERVQSGYSFRPSSRTDGLKSVARRDLAVIRAMLQDALDDVDDERNRRMREQVEAVYASPPPPPPAAPGLGGQRPW